MPFSRRHRPDPCEEVSRTLLCRQTPPYGLRVLESAWGLASTAPGPMMVEASHGEDLDLGPGASNISP